MQGTRHSTVRAGRSADEGVGAPGRDDSNREIYSGWARIDDVGAL